MGIHYLDGCRMAVGQDALPRRVISLGGRFGYVDDGQTPNTQITYYDYEPAPIIFEVCGLPKDKSYLSAPWDRHPKGTMDSYCGLPIGVVVHCEGGYVANNKAFDTAGRFIREFEPTTPDLNANFIEAVRSRRARDLQADILEGHRSAALVHLANISYRLGRAAPPAEVAERIRGPKELAGAYERLAAHLGANGIDLAHTPATLGALLTVDANTERFIGEFSPEANRLVARDYRPPFVVPANV